MNEKQPANSDLTFYERASEIEDALSRQIGKAVMLERMAGELSDSLMTIRDALAALIRDLHEHEGKYAGIVDEKSLGEYIKSLQPDKSHKLE